jgi:uncharacterized membrane protein
MSLEKRIAFLLHYGTLLASALIGLELVLTLTGAGARNVDFATIGIVTFILLPILRVLLMLAGFLRERDYRLAGVASLVLAIVLAGFLIGVRYGAAAH